MSKTRTERQIQAFVRWLNDVISCRGLEIESFPEDLKNGVIMCHLAEILTNEKLRKFNPHPTKQAHEIDNLSVAFKLLTKSSLRLVNVGPQDVHNGYVKCILGLLWSCVQTYQLTTTNKSSSINKTKTEKVLSPEQTLMKWIESRLEEEKVEAPMDFANGWHDGNKLAHLLHSINPDSIDLSVITTQKQCIDAVLWSSFQLGIPCLLTKDDILNGADSKAMTTWLSYFHQAWFNHFPRAIQQQAKNQLLLNWVNWILPDVQINDFKQLLTIPIQSFKALLVKSLNLDINDIDGNSIHELISNCITKYGLNIRDCTIEDIQSGNLLALNHFVTRLMKHCYRSPDNDDTLERINRYIKTPITDVAKEWKSGDVLMKLATNLSNNCDIDDVQSALNELEATLQIPQIIDSSMIPQLSLSTVSSYIRMIDHHWNLYLQNKLEQNVDEKYVNAWITWSKFELNTDIESFSSLMSMKYLFPLVKVCLPNHYQLDEKYHDEDYRLQFIEHIIAEFNIDIKDNVIEDVVNYEWDACESLLESLFRMRYNLPNDTKKLEKLLTAFYHSKISLYNIYDLKNAWKSQNLITGLYHALYPQESNKSGVVAMAKINEILGIPPLINNNNKFTQITPKLRNMYLSLLMSKMQSDNVQINVSRNIEWMIEWTHWALHNDAAHIQGIISNKSRQEIIDELKDILDSYNKQNSFLNFEQEKILFNYIQQQTRSHPSNINDICQWINRFVSNELGEQLNLKGSIDIRDEWNKGIIVQQLATAINPILLNHQEQLSSISTYYNGILWSLEIPDIIKYTDCDDLIYNSQSSVLAFISLIRAEIQNKNFHTNYLVPWLNSEIFGDTDIWLQNDLQAMNNSDTFRQLCAECLRCDIESEMFPDILREILLQKQLIPMESKDFIFKIINGNIDAKKQFLECLFLKYNGFELNSVDSQYETFVNQQLASFNFGELESKCDDEDVLNELKAEQLLKQVNKLIVSSDIIVPDDINPMVALENIANFFNISHNLTSNDLNIDNFGFKILMTQIEKQLNDVRNKWLLNWVNALLDIHEIPEINNLNEVLLNPNVLSALNKIVFIESTDNEQLAELQNILLNTINKLESSQLSNHNILTPSQFIWKLFKYHNKIEISDDILETEYTKFITEHQIISGQSLVWDNCELLRYMAKQAAIISHRRSFKEQLRVSFDTMDNEFPIMMVLETMDLPKFLECNKLHLYDDKCKFAITYLSSQYIFGTKPNTFIIHWINWLLRTDDFMEESVVNEIKDIINLNVLNDLLLLKSRISQSGWKHQTQSSLKEIVNELCDTKRFDDDQFEINKLLQNEEIAIGEFGWSLFKYFYDITDESDHLALLSEYFQNDQITDMFGKDFENGASITLTAINYANNYGHGQLREESNNSINAALEYLKKTFDLPSLFYLSNCNGNLKYVPFRSRLAFFTLLRLIMIERLKHDELEQKQSELIQDETNGRINGRNFEIGQFVEFTPDDDGQYISAVITAYNSHSKLYDVKGLTGMKGDFGGKIFRFIDESQLLQWVNNEAIQIGDNNCFVDCSDYYNLQCIVESVDDEGLIIIEILDTPSSIKLKMNGERRKVPFHHISKQEKPYFAKDENTKNNLKEYLRSMLAESKNLKLNKEMIEGLKKYEKDNFIGSEMKNQVLKDVLNEFSEKRKLEINSKYTDNLDQILANIRKLMNNKRNVEVSFTVTTGRRKGGDKAQIDITITGPILHSYTTNKHLVNNKNIKSYKLNDENISDLSDGRYKITFIGTGIGLYNIRVIMFGKESPLSPFQFMMKENGGEWLQTDTKGKMTAVKSDTMIAKSNDKISLKQRQKRLRKAAEFSKLKTKETLKNLMKLPESSKEILDEIEIIMQKQKEFDTKKSAISEFQKTNEMIKMEEKLQNEHNKMILSTFKRTMNYPGHILTKYPNSRFAKAHTRRVKIAQFEPNINNAIFMWTESKTCYIRNIKSIKSGVTNSKPWKYCNVEPERCFEVDANGKTLCFHAANQYERDFIVKGFQILLQQIHDKS